ncbi:MAG: hypothetical protein KY445_00440 [Armatimonadetes bacterium]|nr:hypothetical protein [Armatimonadota bacterium]
MTVAKNLSPCAKSAVSVSLPESELSPSFSCLHQAEICREQARDAARLRRFRAAFGLFSTAATLCRHVFSAKEADETARALATERLQQIDIEVATYAELARTLERH